MGIRFARVLLTVSLISAVACSLHREIKTYRDTQILLGTFVTIAIYGSDRDEAELETIVKRAFQRIREIENHTSSFVDTSEVRRLKAFAGLKKISISTDLHQILHKAEEISEISGGAFDITVEPLLELWNFEADTPRVPTKSQIYALLPLIDYRGLFCDSSTAFLTRKGMGIDLGGIAKGYAVDQAIEVLRREGIQDALVDAGGDLRLISSERTRGRRRVWIRHPRKPQGFFGYFRQDSGAVATSGDYEKFFVWKGQRYHHLLDPRTGYPARKSISATVIAPTAMEADALATAVFVLGPKEGLALIERLPEIEGVILAEEEGKIRYWVSSGLKDKLVVTDRTLD